MQWSPAIQRTVDAVLHWDNQMLLERPATKKVEQQKQKSRKKKKATSKEIKWADRNTIGDSRKQKRFGKKQRKHAKNKSLWKTKKNSNHDWAVAAKVCLLNL